MNIKPVCLLAVATGLTFMMSACSNDDIADLLAGESVTISGTITSTRGIALENVRVEAVYSSPGGALNPVAITDAGGNYALQAFKNDTLYLHASKSAYVTTNTARATFDVDQTNIDLVIYSEAEAQAVIDAALVSTAPVLINHAWLLIDVVDVTGDELNGQAVISTVMPTEQVYTECDGTDSGGGVTTGAPCPVDREAPMYIAYFDSPGETSISVDGGILVVPIRMGEFTHVVFEP
jgi:hypothetical protein